MRYRVHVLRIDTPADSAFMIEDKPCRDRPDQLLVCLPMRHRLAAFPAHARITVSVKSAGPTPARRKTVAHLPDFHIALEFGRQHFDGESGEYHGNSSPQLSHVKTTLTWAAHGANIWHAQSSGSGYASVPMRPSRPLPQRGQASPSLNSRAITQHLQFRVLFRSPSFAQRADLG